MFSSVFLKLINWNRTLFGEENGSLFLMKEFHKEFSLLFPHRLLPYFCPAEIRAAAVSWREGVRGENLPVAEQRGEERQGGVPACSQGRQHTQRWEASVLSACHTKLPSVSSAEELTPPPPTPLTWCSPSQTPLSLSRICFNSLLPFMDSSYLLLRCGVWGEDVNTFLPGLRRVDQARLLFEKLFQPVTKDRSLPLAKWWG